MRTFPSKSQISDFYESLKDETTAGSLFQGSTHWPEVRKSCLLCGRARVPSYQQLCCLSSTHSQHLPWPHL